MITPPRESKVAAKNWSSNAGLSDWKPIASVVVQSGGKVTDPVTAGYRRGMLSHVDRRPEGIVNTKGKG